MKTTVTEKRTVTVEEAAKALGIGRGHAYELARRGELPGVLKLGRRFVVSRAALDRALDDPRVRNLTDSERED
jgi:excisionase family DNA binding protein